MSLLLPFTFTVQILTGNDRSTLQNGHDFKDTITASASINKAAHHINSEIESHDFAPATNGVAHLEDSTLSGTRSPVEPTSSSFPTSEETDNSAPPSSIQSAPDGSVNLSSNLSSKLDDASLDAAPTIVQQPMSDVREEPHPTGSEMAKEDTKADVQLEATAESISANGDGSGMTNSEDTNPTNEQEPGPGVPHLETPAGQPDPIPTTTLPNHPPVPVPDAASVEAPIDPAPSPAPLEQSSAPPQKREALDDHPMTDAPPSPSKVAREREDDDLADGPAAKRSKTEDDVSTDFKVPERPAINTQVNGVQAEDSAKGSQPMTPLQHKALMRAMQNVKRVQAAAPFRQPVDPVALNIPSYPNIITKPMDLRTLEENLKASKYANVDAFIADFNQIVENCRTFNGPEHTVTKLAYDMRTSFEKQMEKVPGPDVVDLSPADKKKKTGLPPMAKMSAPRRESRSSLPGAARSPVSAVSTPTSAQTFALGPQGVPLIRRDSTVGDGRPKREIHPPAPRDLPYANQKPKKKKYQYELRFCEKILSELQKAKYINLMGPFNQPVDPVALNIPTYHSIIKKPMDFGTMKGKLEHGEYENAKEFEADARQVFQNCYKFNRPQDFVYATGRQLEGIFDSEWAKKRDWIEANTPSSGAQSPGSSEAEDSEEDDEEEAEEEDEDITQLTKLQQQIAQMSRQVELISQKKKSPPVSNKKAAKSAKSAKKESKKPSAPSKVEKKPSRPAKKTPYVTYEQKQDISNRINSLSETNMATALKIIRDNMPNLKVGDDVNISLYALLYFTISAILEYDLNTNHRSSQGGHDDEIELDIDELTDDVLHKCVSPCSLLFCTSANVWSMRSAFFRTLHG